MGLFDKIKKAVKETVNDALGADNNNLTDNLANVRSMMDDLRNLGNVSSLVDDIRNNVSSLVDDIRAEGSSLLGTGSAAQPTSKPAARPAAKPAPKPAVSQEPALTPKQKIARRIIDVVKKGSEHLPGVEVTIDDEGDIRILSGRSADGLRPIVFWMYIYDDVVLLDSKMLNLPENADMKSALQLPCFTRNSNFDYAKIDEKGKLHIRMMISVDDITGEEGASEVKTMIDYLIYLWNEVLTHLGIGPDVFKLDDAELLKVGKIISDTAEADSDGDVCVSFPAGDSFNIRRTVWLMLGSDVVKVQMVMRLPCDVDKAQRALDSMSLDSGVSGKVSDDGVIRFDYLIRVAEYTDLAGISRKAYETVNLLGRQTAGFCRAIGHDYVNRKPLINSDIILDLVKKDGAQECKVDSDGDVQAYYSKALDHTFRWFAWYMFSGNEIHVDSGSPEIADCLVHKDLAENINGADGLNDIVKAVLNDNGNLRIRASIPFDDKEKFVDKWVEVQSTLNAIWDTVYEIGEKMEEQRREEEARREAARRAQQSRRNDDDEEEDEEEESRSVSRSRRSSSSSSSADRERKAEEKREKEAKKRRKEEKIARYQSGIKDLETYIATDKKNLELLQRRPAYNADRIKGIKQSIAQRRAQIKYWRDEIARIRREE